MDTFNPDELGPEGDPYAGYSEYWPENTVAVVIDPVSGAPTPVDDLAYAREAEAAGFVVTDLSGRPLGEATEATPVAGSSGPAPASSAPATGIPVSGTPTAIPPPPDLGGDEVSPYDETLRANPRGYPSDATATDRARLFEAETNAARQSKKSDTATDEDDDVVSSSSGGSTWTDWGSSGGRSRSSGGYGGSYGGGGEANPYSPVDAMRGAMGGGAGAMGMALRGAMGAPMPYMPGQDGGGGDDERQSVYNPGGGAYVASGGVPQAAPAPSGEGRYPPWPGAYQTRQALAGAGGGGGGSAPAAPAMGPYAAGRRPVPRIQPPGQTAGRGFPAPSSQRGRGKPPARRGRK